MAIKSFVLFLVIELSIDRLVLSEILCKDSRIDAITYANDLGKYFFTSGGYYWWITKDQFPPKDQDAKRLPEPFKMGHAAVYVDTETGCASYQSSGKAPKEKVVWVEELVDREHKLMAFDISKDQFRQPISYSEDRCIGRAKIDWGDRRPIDAMFVRSYLEIYVVMDKKYAMVDCKFVCTNPDNYAVAKSFSYTTDFGTNDQIYGMFIKEDRTLTMFHKKYYYIVTINSNKDGKLSTIKGTTEYEIVKDFLKIENPGQCSAPQPEGKPGPPDGGNPGADGGSGNPDGQGSNDGNGDKKDFPWVTILIVIVVIVIIAVVGVLGFLMLGKKSNADQEAAKAKPPVSPKAPLQPNAVKPGGAPPTAARPGPAGAPPAPGLDKTSTTAVRSNMGVTGVGSKSAIQPKAPAKPPVKK